MDSPAKVDTEIYFYRELSILSKYALTIEGNFAILKKLQFIGVNFLSHEI